MRLWTSSQRVKVHHLCEQDGFIKTIERAPYNAPPLPHTGLLQKLLVRLAHPGSRALELACGLGRDALWLAAQGYTLVDPGRYQNNTEDYSNIISQFKSAGCESFSHLIEQNPA